MKMDDVNYIKKLTTIDPPVDKKKLEKQLELIEQAYKEELISEKTYIKCKKLIEEELKKLGT